MINEKAQEHMICEGEKQMDKPILDVCCGPKMFWFDKNNPYVVFCDKRTLEKQEYYPKRYIEISPDVVCDFTNLPFRDQQFKLVVFDPPHLLRASEKSWIALKYGKLEKNWAQMINDGFEECMRVLDDYGVLIFKWSEVQINLKQILESIDYTPLFGHRGGKNDKTHWLCFMKLPKEDKNND